MKGVRAEFRVNRPDGCAVVEASTGTDATVNSVTWAAPTDAGGEVCGTFTVHGDAVDVDATETFHDGTRRVYRFTRPADSACPCSVLHDRGYPVQETRARDGTLYLGVYAASVDDLRPAVRALRERYDRVALHQLVAADECGDGDPVVVDRSRLTDRQREVLEVAHGMGYFEFPKGANASEVAEALDIDPSTFGEHLSAAQSKLMDAILPE